jgi:carbon monoxide dehydrogenase subunit G
VVDVVRTRTVAADVDQVWAALADFGAISRWAPNVDHSCLMSDRTEGIGTVRRIQTGRTTVVERVTEWQPGRALGYSIEGLPPILGSVVNRWTVEPAGGDTRVSLTSSVDTGPRPPRRLVARVVRRRLASASDEMLAGLDRYLTERQGAVR